MGVLEEQQQQILVALVLLLNLEMLAWVLVGQHPRRIAAAAAALALAGPMRKGGCSLEHLRIAPKMLRMQTAAGTTLAVGGSSSGVTSGWPQCMDSSSSVYGLKDVQGIAAAGSSN
jgi:hypothetical protein